MDFDDLALFARWMKQRREALDLTQKELADTVACSLSTISKMEMGLRRPSKQVAELLAISLEIDANERPAFMQFARGNAPAPPRKDLPPLPSVSLSPHPAASATHSSGAHALHNGVTAEELRSRLSPPTNLPAPLTSFIGREGVLERIRTLLWRTDVRILTLTGPPGIGKTRLSIEAVSGLVDDFSDGVFFVPLAPITDPALVLHTIAGTIGMAQTPQPGDLPLARRLADYLRNKNLLLILDNFEHVVDAAEDVAHLLVAAGRLKVLATSRMPLHISGEHGIAIPPMELPHEKDATSAEELRHCEAVQLFLKRAQMAQPDFASANEDAHTVAEMCRRLDGLPLAIELAAARSRFYTPQALLAALQTRLALLTEGPKDLPARHRTLRAAISWSYNLLDETEQAMFRRLGAFMGGFTAEAATWVCGEEIVSDVHTPLESLAEKNLIAGSYKTGEPRYSTLETIREYALAELQAHEGEDHIRRLHADYFADLAEEAEAHMAGPRQTEWLDKLSAEHDNVRAALNWLLDHGRGDAELTRLSLRLSADMSRFWYLRGLFAEGKEWLDRALRNLELIPGDASDKETRLLQVRALDIAGRLAWSQGDSSSARECWESGLALNQSLGDKQRDAHLLNGLATLALDKLNYEEAIAFYERGLILAREVEEWGFVAGILNNIASVYRNTMNYAAARRAYEESLSLYRQIGDKANVVAPLNNLGLVSMDLEDYAAARIYQREALQLSRELGNKQGLTYALAFMGQGAVQEGDFDTATEIYSEAVPLARDLDHKSVLAGCFEWIAAMCEQLARPLEAARLWGAAAALREAIGLPLPLPTRPRIERHVASARAQASPVEFDAAWAEGHASTLAEAVESALQSLS